MTLCSLYCSVPELVTKYIIVIVLLLFACRRREQDTKNAQKWTQTLWEYHLENLDTAFNIFVGSCIWWCYHYQLKWDKMTRKLRYLIAGSRPGCWREFSNHLLSDWKNSTDPHWRTGKCPQTTISCQSGDRCGPPQLWSTKRDERIFWLHGKQTADLCLSYNNT